MAKTQEDLDQFYGAILGKPQFKISLDILEARFKSEDFNPLEEQVIEEPKTFFSMTDEERCFFIGNLRSKSFNPLSYGRCQIPTPSGNFVFFSDCGETALHNFIYHLCTKRTELGLKTNPDLLPDGPAKSFIEKYPEWEAHLTPEVRTEMAQMVANIPGITYCKEKEGFRYEIKNGLDHIDKILRHLFNMKGESASLGSSQSFREIIQLIEVKLPSKKIEFGGSPFQSNALGALTVTDKSTDTQLGSLGIFSCHSHYVSTDKASIPYIPHLLESLSNPVEAKKMTSLLDLYSDPDVDFNEPCDLKYEKVRKAKESIWNVVRSLENPFSRLNLYQRMPSSEIQPLMDVFKEILSHDLENIPYALGILQYVKSLEDRYTHGLFEEELEKLFFNPRVADNIKIQLMEFSPFDILLRDSILKRLMKEKTRWFMEHKFTEPTKYVYGGCPSIDQHPLLRNEVLQIFPYLESASVSLTLPDLEDFSKHLSKTSVKKLSIKFNDTREEKEVITALTKSLPTFPPSVQELGFLRDFGSHTLKAASLEFLKSLLDIAHAKKIGLDLYLPIGTYLKMLEHMATQNYPLSLLGPSTVGWNKDFLYINSQGAQVTLKDLDPDHQGNYRGGDFDFSVGPFNKGHDSWFLEKCLEIVGHKKDEALGERAGPAE
ncbi:MAG: hypothetical protein ACK5PQ_01615 [Alphaproteobacteria bacterium]